MSSEHEEVKKDCLEIIDNHIALANMFEEGEACPIVSMLCDWLKLVRNRVEELSYE